MARNVSSLSKSGDDFAEQEDQIADQISTMKQRLARWMVDGKEPHTSSLPSSEWENSYFYFYVNIYIFSLLLRFREDEVRAEMGEREVQKLQKEVDKLEVNFV